MQIKIDLQLQPTIAYHVILEKSCDGHQAYIERYLPSRHLRLDHEYIRDSMLGFSFRDSVY